MPAFVHRGRDTARMANLVTRGWAGGANVIAYPANALAPSRDGAPAGASVETVAADAAGTATHLTLADNTPYLLYQASPYRVVRARVASSATDRGEAAGTVNTTNGSVSFASLAATSGAFLVGQRVSGPGIPRGTRIKTLSGGAGTFDRKATATGTGVAVEAAGGKDPLARTMRRRHDRGTS